jgi:hypothetical protein
VGKGPLQDTASSHRTVSTVRPSITTLGVFYLAGSMASKYLVLN